jgi:hypothetical protein
MSYKNRTEVERLLDQLCTDLGFCLPPNEYARLQSLLPLSIDAFIDQVFMAEGLEPQVKTELRRQVRERVARRFAETVENNAT